MLRFRLGWHRLDTVSGILVVLTILRALVVCLSNPIAAYANNYDFVRQSSCVGVWQDYGSKDKTLNNPERPINSLIVDGDIRQDVCMRSSDNAVPWLVAHVAGPGAHVGLRSIGFVKIIILLGVLVTVFSQPIYPLVRLALMITAYMLFGDIAVLSYFDTLYLDASVIIFCFGSIALAVSVWCRTRGPRFMTLAVLLLMVAWFECTKLQYAPYAAMAGFLGCSGFLIRWQSRRLFASGVAGLAVMQALYLGVFLSSNEHTRQIQKANLADTFLEAVLPAAPDKARALSIVGLPQTCLPAIGLNWYDPRVNRGELCPEVFKTHRVRLLRLFAELPETFVQPMLHGAANNRPFYLSVIGHFERPADVGRWRFRILTATSLSTWLALPSDTAYAVFVIFLSLLGLIGFVLVSRRVSQEKTGLAISSVGWLIYGCSGTLAFYAVGSAVFGDGYGDLQRHCVGILIGTAFCLGGLLLVFYPDRPKSAARPAYVVRLPQRRPTLPR